jgi:hypothetical protein
MGHPLHGKGAPASLRPMEVVRTKRAGGRWGVAEPPRRPGFGPFGVRGASRLPRYAPPLLRRENAPLRLPFIRYNGP